MANTSDLILELVADRYLVAIKDEFNGDIGAVDEVTVSEEDAELWATEVPDYVVADYRDVYEEAAARVAALHGAAYRLAKARAIRELEDF